MHPQRWVLVAALALATGYAWLGGGFVGITSVEAGQSTLVTPALKPGQALATFASGCFWCTDADFDKLPGRRSPTAGWPGGKTPKPSYKVVTPATPGPAAAGLVVYHPAIVRSATPLDHHCQNAGPLVAHRRFCNAGRQYRPVIYFHCAEAG